VPDGRQAVVTIHSSQQASSKPGAVRTIEHRMVAAAIEKYGLDPAKPNPMTV
jgi:pyruvate dehydrogenase complex dehydrogenase (E1) component